MRSFHAEADRVPPSLGDLASSECQNWGRNHLPKDHQAQGRHPDEGNRDFGGTLESLSCQSLTTAPFSQGAVEASRPRPCRAQERHGAQPWQGLSVEKEGRGRGGRKRAGVPELALAREGRNLQNLPAQSMVRASSVWDC